MSISMYEASAPVFIRALKVMSALLDKGEAHAREAGTDPEALVQARLYEDMANLAGQVQRASDASKLAIARLSGVAAPPMEDNETTLDQLRDRLARTIAYIESVDRAALDGTESKEIVLTFGTSYRAEFEGKGYLLTFAIPNFFFHVTTAYAILRNQGVPVGKRDFLGS